jgi:hypothetical protein
MSISREALEALGRQMALTGLGRGWHREEGHVPGATAKEASDPSASIGNHYGGWKPKWRASVTPDEFIAARDKSTRGGYLSGLTKDELKSFKLLLSEDGTVGGALSKDGDMCNLFNNGGPKGAAAEVLLKMMAEGGKTADCFDGYLPHLYAQFGLVESGRMKFNPDYAPKGWNFARDGHPDVVFLRKGPDVGDANAIRQRVANPAGWRDQPPSKRYYDDYDQGKHDAAHGG